MRTLWQFKSMMGIACVFSIVGYIFPVSAQITRVDTTDQFSHPVRVEINRLTGTAHRIWWSHPNIARFGIAPHQLNDRNIEALANAILVSYQDLLKAGPSHLVIRQAETDGENWYISFEQRYKNLPVYGASAGITLSAEGKIVSIGADAYPDVQVSSVPNIFSEQQAEAIANADFTTAGMDTVFRRSPSRLLIYPHATDNAITYHLAYLVELQSNLPLKGQKYFIDAHTGKKLAIENIFRDGTWNINGNVSGQYWPEQENVNTTTETPQYLSSLRIYNTLGQTVATGTINGSGNYSITWTAAYGTYWLESKLQSSWIQLRSGGDFVKQVFQFTSSSNTVHDFQFSAGNQGYTVYHHGNLIHDFFKGYPFYYSSMDYQMQANINAGSEVNGAADGTNISFGSQYGILWLGASDVAYHEYTHNTIYHLYGNNWIASSGGYQGAAMDEGISDYFAATINGNSWIELANRNLSNTRRFPTNFTPGGDPHINGLIIGGAAWDLQQLVGTTTGRDLIFEALQMTPHAFSFTDFVNNVIVADDNNGTLCDYTPNSNQILEAFETNHGVSPTNLPSGLTVSISGPDILANGEGGTWTANPCGGQGSYTYEWRYRWYGTGSWIGPVGTAQNYSRTMWEDDFELQVKVTSGGEIVYDTYYVINSDMEKRTGDYTERQAANIPGQFELLQNFPNPFNPETIIRFDLPKNTHAQMVIIDLLRREVRKLVDGDLKAGYHSVVWDGKDNAGNEVTSGIYVYQITAGNFRNQKKLAVVR